MHNKLNAGIYTIGQVHKTPEKKLLEIKGFSEARVKKVQDACARVAPENTFMSGTECFATRQKLVRLTTGSSQIDDALYGGIEWGSLTELFGEARVGKTQLLHTLAVTTQLDLAQGGGAGKVLYIDTEGCFRPERISMIAERFGIRAEDCLNNILVARVHTHDKQMQACHEAGQLIVQEGEPVRLLIIDSITALFRSEYSGRGELATRQQRLAVHLRCLQNIASEFNVAVVYSNQMMSDPGAMFAACALKPIGGNILAHASHLRMWLKKAKDSDRVLKIFDSPNVAEQDVEFMLSDGGVCDRM